MIFKGIEVDDITEKSEEIKKRKEPETNSWGAENLEAGKKKESSQELPEAEGKQECGFTKENKILNKRK